MKRTLKVLLLTLLCAAICLPMTAMAYSEISVPEAKEFLEIYINPLYSEQLSKDDVLALTADIPVAYSDEIFNDIDAAGTYLREKMIARETSVSFVYSGFAGTPDELFWSIYEEAVKHTGAPNEGDYIKSHLIWFTDTCQTVSESDVLMEITLIYLTDAELEKAVDDEVAKLLTELALDGKSDYEKVEAVHHWICENITYDYDNLEDTEYLLKHSTYAALINKTAVCQGYASLFYRLMLELGIDCRYITGTGNGGAHSWNIVKLGELYYNIDTTWDAESYQAYGDFQACRYFLTCDANFDGHERDDEYTTAEFNAAYPMAQSDFDNRAEEPDYEHEVHDGIVFEAWNNTRKLPDTAGNYYLTADVVLSEVWKAPAGEVNLCLNGHSIIYYAPAFDAAMLINADSTVDIYDCSEDGSGTVECYGYYVQGIANEGTLTVHGGNIVSGGDYVYGIYNSGMLTVDGGTVKGDWYGVYNIGTAVINGGSVSGDMWGIVNNNTLTVNGGTINGDTGISVDEDGILTVNGGNISGNYYGINVGNIKSVTGPDGYEESYFSSGTVIFNNGTVIGGQYGISNDIGTVTVAGGNIIGDFAGIYNSDGFTEVDGEIINGGNNILTVKGGTISGSDCGINNSGTLTIEDGTINGTGENGVGLSNDGALTINGGCIFGEAYGLSPRDDTVINGGTISSNGTGIWGTGTFDIYGGTISGGNYGIEIAWGNVTVISGAISGDKAGILVYSDGTLNLSGDAAISGRDVGILLPGSYITVVGELENAEPYTVAMGVWDPESESYIVSQNYVIPEAFTNTEEENLQYNDPAKFAPADIIAEQGYIVVKNDDGQLQFVLDKPQGLLGDINGDGKVDVQDGVLMQRILANLETNEEYLARADLNGDGEPNVQDGVKMQRILANLE